MKIAIFSPNIDPTAGGGFTFERDIYARLEEYAEKSPHEFVVYSTEKGLVHKVCEKIKFAMRTAQDVLFERRFFCAKSWFEKDLKAKNVDLVWFLTPDFVECDLPFVFTVWDIAHVVTPWFPELSKHGQWQRRHQMYTRVLERASQVISPNPVATEQLVNHYRVERGLIRMLPHPTPRFALEAKANADDDLKRVKKLGIEKDFIFYPAQFWPHKNHVNLLHAVKILRDRDAIQVEVVFSGSDKGNMAHVRQTAEELGVKAHFLGFVETADLVSLYRRASLMAYLSLFGPENLPPLEAFALGCPILASDIAGAKEQLGTSVLYAAPTAVEDIAAGMKQILQDRQLRDRLIESGKKRALEWTSKNYVESMMRYFDEFQLVRRCWPFN